MTLMTRCTYRFYHRPEELRRLNNSTLIIGDPASGKSFATRLFKLLASPIVAADQVGKDAINAYREQMRTKGANKEKPKKPKVVVRIHPARTSNAQFIQDMVNGARQHAVVAEGWGVYRQAGPPTESVSQRGGRTGIFERRFGVSGVLCDLELHLHRYAHRAEEDGERAELRFRTRHAFDLYPAACHQIPDDGRGGDRGL